MSPKLKKYMTKIKACRTEREYQMIISQIINDSHLSEKDFNYILEYTTSPLFQERLK